MPSSALDAGLRLISFDQIANALRVSLAVSMAGDRVGAARGFDTNFRPEHARGNVHRRNLRHGNAFLVAAEQARLHAADPLRTDNEARGKNKVALGPAARGKSFSRRAVHRIVESRRHAFSPREAEFPLRRTAGDRCLHSNRGLVFSRGLPLLWIGSTELLYWAVNIRRTPLLDDLAANHAKNSDLLDCHSSTVRRKILERDLVALGYDVIHSLLPIGKRSPVP